MIEEWIMVENKVIVTDTQAIIPRDAYIEFACNIAHAGNLLEKIEGMGDDMFQAHVLSGIIYLLCRSFPNYLEGAKSERSDIENSD